MASSYEEHPRHGECDEFLTRVLESEACCGAHTLAEVYSALTRLILPEKITAFEAFQVVQRTSSLFKIITLTEAEYLATIASVAERGLTGAIVYDALLLACARKIDATAIYTLNLRHFRLVAPDLASRILEP